MLDVFLASVVHNCDPVVLSQHQAQVGSWAARDLFHVLVSTQMAYALTQAPVLGYKAHCWRLPAVNWIEMTDRKRALEVFEVELAHPEGAWVAPWAAKVHSAYQHGLYQVVESD